MHLWLLWLLLLSSHQLTAALNAAAACDFCALHPRRLAVYHLYAGLAPNRRQHVSQTSRASLSEVEEVSAAITIDGRLDEAAWEEAPWSEDFVDIRGQRHWSQPWLATRVKLRFDDRFLYVGAYVEETAVWANVSARNSVVFADNDFEVFVDADGSTHNYKELEVNAVNTTWNLSLNRPYRDGGHENSTRVDPAFGFDMFGKGLQSAVFMKGTPNDPGV